MVVGLRRKTKEMRWVLLRSTQPTKNVMGWVGAGLLRLSLGGKIDRLTRPYRFYSIVLPLM